MTLNEYQTKALRTARMPTETCSDLLHGALGVMTEVVELHDAHDEVNTIEELGDVMWYCALLCRATGSNLEDVWDEDVGALAFRNVLTDAGKLLDLVKRQLAYGKPADQLEVNRLVGRIVIGVHVASVLAGSCIEEVCERNIAKLQKRFPEKFTEAAAVNRDVAAEREVLEA